LETYDFFVEFNRSHGLYCGQGLVMDSIDNARQLKNAGRYREALGALSGPQVQPNRMEGTVLRAELLERLGQHTQARRLADVILKSRGSSTADRATSEHVIGRVLADSGDVDGA
jgi:hypothetical protein